MRFRCHYIDELLYGVVNKVSFMHCFLVLSISMYRSDIRLRCEKHGYMTLCVVNIPDAWV
jgi:hypothetical protein